jgi:hypothetical protein
MRTSIGVANAAAITVKSATIWTFISSGGFARFYVPGKYYACCATNPGAKSPCAPLGVAEGRSLSAAFSRFARFLALTPSCMRMPPGVCRLTHSLLFRLEPSAGTRPREPATLCPRWTRGRATSVGIRSFCDQNESREKPGSSLEAASRKGAQPSPPTSRQRSGIISSTWHQRAERVRDAE